MQRAIRYLIDSYGLSNIDELYAYLKEEIKNSPTGDGQSLFPNPLRAVDCVHIENTEHRNQPVYVEGSLDLVEGLELYTTCFPKRKTEGIVWSEPLYVELKDLMICPGDSPECLSRCGRASSSSSSSYYQLAVDELDLHSASNSDDDKENDATW
ncbi:hypothetical protein niasHT_010999 [Heterodera trifolii]|uniref:Uncharacterized protein n=1 Tax=Heterodera trifolii TaxID=157864 RepID=A0ABD2LG31_9BILA